MGQPFQDKAPAVLTSYNRLPSLIIDRSHHKSRVPLQMEWAIGVENIKLEKIFPIEKHMPLVRNNKSYFPDRNGYLGVAEKNGSK